MDANFVVVGGRRKACRFQMRIRSGNKMVSHPNRGHQHHGGRGEWQGQAAPKQNRRPFAGSGNLSFHRRGHAAPGNGIQRNRFDGLFEPAGKRLRKLRLPSHRFAADEASGEMSFRRGLLGRQKRAVQIIV